VWLENKLKENRFYIAAFCLPINCFLIYLGIITNDPYAIILACLSTGLVIIPLLRKYDGEEKQIDKRSPPGQTD
jgi:hypothetical protein